MSMIGWGLLASLGALTAWLGWLWRKADAARSDLEASVAELVQSLDALQTKLARETEGRKRQAEELSDFRRRADKARRRSSRSQKPGGDRPVGTATRMADLETRLAAAERDRDRARAECDRLSNEGEHLRAEASAARRLAETEARRSSEPVEVAEGPTPVTAEASADLEARLEELGEALEASKRNEARLRKRMGTQEQLYASLRAELEVKKDRLRAQEERIQRLEAFRVVVSD